MDVDDGDRLPDFAAAADAGDDAMAWLEDLAAGQGDSLFDHLDLSSLSDEIEAATTAPGGSDTVDPVNWLENLTQTQGEDDSPAPAQPTPEPADSGDMVSDPFASGVDPMAWLEELARRQNANPDELTTDTRMNIPTVDEGSFIDDSPGYKPFEMTQESSRRPQRSDAPPPRTPPRQPTSQPEPADDLGLEDPADWLGSLANAGELDAQDTKETNDEAPADPSFELDDIQRAIADGTVTPEQMQYFLNANTDRAIEAGLEDLPAPPDDDDDEPVPAELPDWLIEQVGAPPGADPARTNTEDDTLPPLDLDSDADDATSEGAQPALIDEITEPPAVSDMPEWLLEDLEAQNSMDFENIFVESDEADGPPVPHEEPDMPLDYEIEVDPSDPWVEAFDMEHVEGAADIHNVPSWYVENLNNPDRIAAVEQMARDDEPDEPALAEADLPDETDLPPGEMQALPDWYNATDGAAAAQATAPAAEILDWVDAVEANVDPDEIPDWLKETIEETTEEEAPAPPPPPARPAQPPPQPQAQPAAPPRPAAVNATVASARSRAQSGDIDGSLLEYEALIRASSDLDTVVADLSGLAEAQPNNPTVYRVLGDGLMRQGRLQDALDIYRQALNQL